MDKEITQGISEWVWRFIAAAMVVLSGWLAWVLYLLNPPPLVMPAAFAASAGILAKTTREPQQAARAEAAAPPVLAAPVATEAKPEAPKPAPEAKPEPVKPNPAEVLETLESWARAWSARDADAYLAFYAKDFKGQGGEPRDAWEKARRSRVTAPKFITVTVDSPRIDIIADDRVTVAFRQVYKSDIVVASGVNKVLELQRVDGRWLIVKESSSAPG